MDGGDGGAGRCMEGGRRVENDINQILLKYRPIAPKPVVGGSGLISSGSSLLNGKRTKRKYVRVSSGRCKNKVKVKEEENETVTLQLLPERIDPEDGTAQLEEPYGDVKKSDLRALERNSNNDDINNNTNNNFDVISNKSVCDEGLGRAVRGIVSGRVVESWIVLESVENNLYGNDQCHVIWNDSIVQHQLVADSYPGFISRAESGRVEWVNEAYRRMVGCGNHTLLMIVWLEIKEEVAEVISRVRNAFSCWVKVQYNSNEDDGRRGMSMALPCDARRVESGGFAWRLDPTAALCLGIVTDSVDVGFRPS